MTASDQGRDGAVCGKWMPRRKTHCARTSGHGGSCKTPEAMTQARFEEDQPIFMDHDHACCPDEKSSCGKCARGLLCLSCNAALGLIERKYELARAYLDSPPAHIVVAGAA
jgi:Recombination endonuclease VII